MKDTNRKVNKTLYAVLTLLLGTFGINKFYAGKIKSGLLSILFCWTGIPTILSVAEFITVLTEKADKDGVATPADWRPGEDVIVPTAGSCGTAKERMESKSDDMYCLDWFMCF